MPAAAAGANIYLSAQQADPPQVVAPVLSRALRLLSFRAAATASATGQVARSDRQISARLS